MWRSKLIPSDVFAVELGAGRLDGASQRKQPDGEDDNRGTRDAGSGHDALLLTFTPMWFGGVPCHVGRVGKYRQSIGGGAWARSLIILSSNLP